MVMPGRSFEVAGAYRYGFNGKEKEDGINIDNYDFGARIYDGRVGRFLSVDPESKDYPQQSVYCYSANSPLSIIDKDGNGPQIIIQYGANFAINVAMQMVTSYMFDKDVKTIADAWDKVSMWDAAKESAMDMVGTKKFQMAFNAAKQVFDYIDQVGIDNVTAGGLVANGFMGLVEPLLAKYDAKKVAQGLAKMGIDAKMLDKVYGKGSTWKGPIDYSDLDKVDKYAHTRGPGKEFTDSQRSKIKELNKKKNDGYLRDDEDGSYLDPSKSYPKGSNKNMNQAEVDHKIPKSPKDNSLPGDNRYSNARVISAKKNLAKSNN
jgi:RHS repeat-associated protein